MSIAYGVSSGGAARGITKDKSSVGNSISVGDNTTGYPVIDIHVSCKNLAKMDIGSPSDPMAVMFTMGSDGKYVECARTEVIWNNPNPQFVRFFQAMYMFEQLQPLRFAIYDVDSQNAALKKHDFIGYIDTDVASCIGSIGSSLEFDLKHPDHANQSRGKITLITEQCVNSRDVVVGKVKAAKMKKMRTFSKNHPYILFAKPSESGVSIPVFRSETVEKAYQCTWKEFKVPVRNICNGDLDTPIDVILMDDHQSKADKPIGKYTATLRSLMESVGQPLQALTMDGRKEAGIITFTELSIVKQPTFIDYLTSGLRLNMVTAIDFTASNGNAASPRSLHYFAPGTMNQYELCIRCVGSILAQYDATQQFTVLGFGGAVGNHVDHCCLLPPGAPYPFVIGLPGIVQCYQQSLAVIRLAGPTCFAPVIRETARIAMNAYQQDGATYTVLLIITDGVINDFRETRDAIVAASQVPMSIIIVGVGNADFSAMEKLDGDEERLKSSAGVYASRDIVQFVPFAQYAHNPTRLASEVLAEIPQQIDCWARTSGFIQRVHIPNE